MAVKIYLYDNEEDCIGSGNLSSAYIQYQLEAAQGQDVEIHISSVGGSAFDAIAIYDLLKQYPGTVTTHIDALAASAASIVAMAGKTVVMSKYALLMIHKPMVGSGGNADELLKDVQMLNIVQTRLAAIYMDKSGLDIDTVNSLINAVTWMTADQALDLGFIDQIQDYSEASEKVKNSALIKKYTSTAPAIYQRCINKILLTETEINQNDNIMNAENKELFEKTNSVLDKILNFFKKTVNNKTVTSSGDFHHAGVLNVGTEVFNDEDMEDKVENGDYEVDNQVITIQEGKVAEIKNKEVDPDEDDDDDENTDGDPDKDEDEDDMDPDNRAALNVLNIEVTNKATVNDAVKAIMPKLTELQNTVNAQNELLVEAKTALDNAKKELAKKTEDIKAEIRSTFVPQSSKRSHTIGAKEDKEVSDAFRPKEGSKAAAVLNVTLGRAKAKKN